jgi:hypothetical protein
LLWCELLGKVYTLSMDTADSYSIGFFVSGNYHMLCRVGKEYRFHVIKPHGDFEAMKFSYHEARTFIETHPVCANITYHDIRIMEYSEVQNVLQGTSAENRIKSLRLSSEEEEEEPLH